ncbi:M28 family peptidase, partial [Gemmatimonadota bacterium]
MSLRSSIARLFRPLSIPFVAGMLAMVVALSGCSGPRGSSSEAEVLSEELHDHVAWLASDALQGRRSGTPSGDRAARYLANEFDRYGLDAVGDDGGYLQAFEFVAEVVLGRDNGLTIEGESVRFQADEDWLPLAFSDNGSGSFEVVFAGYGISSPDDEYDDYAGLDVEGKAVLVLPYGPQIEGGGMRFPTHHALRRKAAVARDHGAAAILIAPHPAFDPPDFLEPLRFDSSPSTAGVLAVTLTVETADILIGSMGNLTDLHTRIDGSVTPESMALDSWVELAVELEMVRRNGYNVVGALTAAGPEAPWIVIGGHYDHLGMGGDGSLEPGETAVHNGADDNASGTAGVLELAQAFAADPLSSRNLLFIAFGAEELGLLGSAYFVSHVPE